MIVGPGWGFLGLLAVGLAAFALVPGCGAVVVAAAPAGQVRLAAPPLVEADPVVEALPAGGRTVSGPRVVAQVRTGVLRVVTTGCKPTPAGSGVALDSQILLAQRDVLSGTSRLKIPAQKGGRASVLTVTHVYRLGELGIASVERGLPRRPPFAGNVALGSRVAVVDYPLSATPRVLPGVVVDSIAGASLGIRGGVLRLTSALRPDDPGGPVVDAGGRIVAVAFGTDPKTGLAVAVPLGTLRSLVAAGSLEALPQCKGG